MSGIPSLSVVRIFCFAAMLLTCVPAAASIVRLDIAFGTQPAGSVYLELFDTDAPATVQNFRNYVVNTQGDRRLDGTFIHRSMPGFILQGGGYRYDPDLGAFGQASAPHIPQDPPIDNEFDAARSNVRGTVAMAKRGSEPNSATSEWFVNLVDNSANLDKQNSGFTVFGQVLGNGMSVVDSTAALPVTNQGGVFTDLPVSGFTSGNPVTSGNLVTINASVSPYPPPLFVASAPLEFGLTPPDLVPLTQQQVTITNTGNNAVTLGSIGNQDPLAAPFMLVSGADNCSNQTLAGQTAAGVAATCTFAISFDPQTLGSVLQDSVDVPYDDGSPSSLTLAVSGTGAFTTPTLEITPDAEVDFGTLGTGEPRTRVVTLRNVGVGQLEPLQPVIGGADAAEFRVSADDCTGTMLNIGESCTLTIELSSLSTGSVSALLSLGANPAGQAAQLSLSGLVTLLQSGIELPDSLALGDTRVGQSIAARLPVANRGIDDLFVSNIELIGTDAGLFTVGIDCVNSAIVASSSCDVQLGFSATQTGSYSVTLRVRSNDPDLLLTDIPLSVTVSEDGDGIPDAVEQSAPNNGDGNQDGVLDKLQERVASLRDASGQFVTLEVPDGMLLSRVATIDNPSSSTVPTIGAGTLEFRNGFFSFAIENVPTGGEVAVTFYLPQGQSANRYFMFGRLPGEPAFLFPEHWYDFSYDSRSRTGAQFAGNRVTLSFVDGGRGDNDQQANGRIVDPGGPAVISVDSGGSSGGGGCSLSSSVAVDRRGTPIDFVLLLVGLIVFRLLWARRVVPV